MDEDKKDLTRLELEDSLNEQQQRFCEAKLFNNNVQAYMIAYPDCSYKAASTSATRLLEDARILRYIELLKLDIEGITGVSKIKNIAELAKIAYSNISIFHNTWIELTLLEKLKEENPDALAAIESTESKTVMISGGDRDVDREVEYVKVKLYSKISAITEINKMMGYNEPEKIDATLTQKKTILEIGGTKFEL